MKKIVFVRHGKSSWAYNVMDIERPLKKRGISDSELVSREFLNKEYDIDLLISSPANRALSTCKIFHKNMNFPLTKLKVIDDLYDFRGNQVLDVIKNLNNTLNTVLLFGHNHAFTDLVNKLGDRYIDNLPTAGLVSISFNITDWAYVKHGTTDLIIFPRDLK